MTDRPIRIQLSRSKGWRMPPNTVSVARPGRWGNPFWDIRRYGRELCINLFRNTAVGVWDPGLILHLPEHQSLWVYRDHCEWLKRIGGHPAELVRSELRGKNLACWCPLNQPCHADVLLELANELANAEPPFREPVPTPSQAYSQPSKGVA